MADIVGHKWGLVLSCLVFSIGTVRQTAAEKLAPFVVGRV
jgi:MFS transporter, SP family, sugar:H+ symporter